jgi:dienelactone hydrolase
VPAVLLVHGSGGLYNAMLDYWPRLLNGAGYAVLSLDMFGPRGVRSTAEDQSQVPLASDLADTYVALKALATHPRIDAQRIAVMGFSRGGLATWRAALQRVAASQQLPAGVQFAAHIPVYSGGCVGNTRVLVKPGVFSRAPMLWIHGDADDYAAMAPCQTFAQEIAAAGTPTEFVVLPGARHKFDADDQRRITVRGAQRTVPDCPLAMDIGNFGHVDLRSGARLQGEALASTQKACQAIGATVEGNRAARDAAGQAVLGFLGRVFGR